jgi:hypothetical protein
MHKLTKILVILALLMVGGLLLVGQSGVYANALQQGSYQTPTPNADGQILYTVQEGDTCIRVSLITLVTLDDIIALNDLGPECDIFPSQQLLLAQLDPITPTPEGPVPTATPGLPTPTPFEGTGQVCVALFEDLDGNQKRSPDELYLGGGVISVSNRVGTYSETKNTVGGDPALTDLMVCFEDLEEGEYNLSMGVPDGYNPTTSMNYALTVTAGDTVVVDFGAQPSTQMIDGDVVPGGGRSPLLLAIGLFLLAGGAGMAFFFIRSRMTT